MAINYYLTPHYVVVFREEDGTPLIAGNVYFFKDSDHVTPKAVFQDQHGNVALPNPVKLNNAGIIAKSDGTPMPVYYANDEDYYIEVYRTGEGPGDTPIQTVVEFNSSLADFPQPSIETSNLTNYILNPQYRFYLEQLFANADLPATTEVVIAEEGWFFYRDTANSTNAIEFKEFAAGQIDVPYNPKNYLEFECTVAGAETRKDIIFPFRDVISFSNLKMSFGIWVRSDTGSPSTLQLVLRQNFGSGGSSTVETIIDTYTVTTSWTQVSTLDFTVPNVAGKTIGTAGDDRLEIVLRMPLNQICILQYVNNQLNIGDLLYDFNYTSSEKESIQKKAYELPNPTDDDYGYTPYWNGEEYIFRNDTGKVEEWLFGDQPDFTLVMDGTTYIRDDYISGTNNKVKYDRLYQKWDNDSNIANGNAFGYGSDGFFPTLYSNTAIFTNTNSGTVTDWADVSTGFTITTEQQSGSLGFSVIFYPYQQLFAIDTIQVTNTSNGDVTDASAGTSGFTVGTIQHGSGSQPEISDVATLAASALSGGEYFLISSTTADYYPWFKVDGVGTDPAVGGRTGLLVELQSTDNSSYVANRILQVLNGNEVTKVVCNAASTLTPADYFEANSVSTPFYSWYEIDGAGTDPAVGGKTGIKVAVLSTDTNIQVAQKTSKTISSYYFVVPDYRGYILRNWANGSTNDPDRDGRVGLNGNIIRGDNVGTIQSDEFREHDHSMSPNAILYYDTVGGGTWATGSKGDHNSEVPANGGNETRMLNAYVLMTIKY